MEDRIYSEREKIEAALQFVSSEDRETWVEVAMAIKSELGEEGHAIWDAWSARSDSYKPASAKAVWRSANATRINIGKLYSLAKQQGFDPKEYRTSMPDPMLMQQRKDAAEERARAQAAEEAAKHARAAQKAEDVLKSSTEAKPDHPYVVRKGIGSANLFEMPIENLSKILGFTPSSDHIPLSGRILIAPVGDSRGTTTLEFIDEAGRKSALPGGRKAGAYWIANQPKVQIPTQIIVGEGIATNRSIAQAVASTTLVVAALSDTNLPNVAKHLKQEYPDVPLVVAADLGKGEKKAIEAAQATDGLYAMPSIKAGAKIGGALASDFNDQAQIDGTASLKSHFSGPLRLEPHELRFSDFARLATVEALVDHGRKWQVHYGQQWHAFSDADNPDLAIQDVHRAAINNTLWHNVQESPIMPKPSMPPPNVLSEYPDLVGKYTPQDQLQKDKPIAQESAQKKPSDRQGKHKESRDFRAELTERIIAQLEQGTAPWQKPWAGSPPPPPINPTTGKPYNGINNLWLSMQGYADPRWATYKQAAAEGWQVRKGERGTSIEFWKRTTTKPLLDEQQKPIIGDDGKPKTITVQLERPIGPIYATVFNLSQMDNAPAYEPPTKRWDWNPIEKAEQILQSSGAKIIHDQPDSAYYSPTRDEIHLPLPEQFSEPGKYYGTALHELGHWTGHESRLNRDLSGGFGSPSYAREELRAELSSYFIAAEYGIPHDVDRHAAYVGSWIEALKSDKNEIFRASRDAESVVRFIGQTLERSRDNEPTKDIRNQPSQQENETMEQKNPSTKPENKTIYTTDSIPIEVRSATRHHFGDRIEIYSPKTNGSYNGIVFNTENHLAQEVGYGSVVMHDKSNLTMIGALAQLDRERKLTGAELQVHYDADGKAKVYPFDRQKDTLDRAVNSLKKSAAQLGLGDDFTQKLDLCREASFDRVRESRKSHLRPLSDAPAQDTPEASRKVTR